MDSTRLHSNWTMVLIYHYFAMNLIEHPLLRMARCLNVGHCNAFTIINRFAFDFVRCTMYAVVERNEDCDLSGVRARTIDTRTDDRSNVL